MSVSKHACEQCNHSTHDQMFSKRMNERMRNMTASYGDGAFTLHSHVNNKQFSYCKQIFYKNTEIFLFGMFFSLATFEEFKKNSSNS